MRTWLIGLSFLYLAACQSPAPAPPPDAPSRTAAPAPMLTPTKPVTPEWARQGVLYECNVRQFSKEGTLNAVTAQLPRLQALGINILWLMPIYPIGLQNRKGSLGSPYSVRDYYAVNPELGTLDDLKQLVQKAHGLGLKVILDWVPNHTAWDAVWMQQHPEFYTKYNGQFTPPLNEHGQPTDWTDCVDLDYGNPSLRSAMIDAMQYWMRTCDVDGFRVDMAGLVPKDFWDTVRPALDTIKPTFMLAEWQDEPGHFEYGFHANYGWKWKDVTKDIAMGKQTAHSLDTLLGFLNSFYPDGYYQMYFTLNHDENSWNGTEKELYGPAADAFNVLAFTWQGIPMIYNGQEDDLNKRLKFFEKDPIRWKNYARAPFFQRLCALKRDNRALAAGPYGGQLEKLPTNDDDHIYAFTREKDGDRVIVVLNLSKEPRNVTLQPGSRLAGAYANVFATNTMQLTADLSLRMKPWEYLVLSNK